jgi:glycosyltransferase involved in cell wall biosynthesis
MKTLFLVPYPKGFAPSQRLKFEQYLTLFEKTGFQIDFLPFFDASFYGTIYAKGNIARKILGTLRCIVRRLLLIPSLLSGKYERVFIHLEAMPLGPPVLEWVAKIRGIPIIYDIDDLVFLKKANSRNSWIDLLRFRNKVRWIMKWADTVIVCTEHLREFALLYNDNVINISSTIDLSHYQPEKDAMRNGVVTAGWSGSHSTAPFLALLAPVIRELGTKHEFRVFMYGATDVDPGFECESQAWSEESEVPVIKRFDIGLYPLPDSEWVLGKSGLKALQYMALGVPPVLNPVGANLNIVEDGVNGLFASSESQWLQQLNRLLSDPELRKSLGSAARKTIEERFSVERNGPLYVRALNGLGRTL